MNFVQKQLINVRGENERKRDANKIFMKLVSADLSRGGADKTARMKKSRF